MTEARGGRVREKEAELGRRCQTLAFRMEDGSQARE